MQSISLKKILLKREILSLLKGLVTKLTTPIVIQDQRGQILVADLGVDKGSVSSDISESSRERVKDPLVNTDLNKIPVVLSDEILGVVCHIC
jgi:adenylate cyclase